MGGDWIYVLILLEFQSTVDRGMALRMADYVVTIWRRLGNDDLGPRGEYPFVLPVVVYNGERRWNAATDVGDLIGPVPGEPLGYRPRLRYLLVDIRSWDLSSLPRDSVLATIARFEQAPTADALEELALSLADWIESVGELGLAEAFMTWITRVLAQRFGPAGRELERRLRSEEGGVSTLIERARKWGEERDQLWLRKGIEKGIEKGREEGLERDRRLMRRLVGRRFGPATAEQVLPVLEGISDPEGIALVGDAVIECATAEEFLLRVRDGTRRPTGEAPRP